MFHRKIDRESLSDYLDFHRARLLGARPQEQIYEPRFGGIPTAVAPGVHSGCFHSDRLLPDNLLDAWLETYTAVTTIGCGLPNFVQFAPDPTANVMFETVIVRESNPGYLMDPDLAPRYLRSIVIDVDAVSDVEVRSAGTALLVHARKDDVDIVAEALSSLFGDWRNRLICVDYADILAVTSLEKGGNVCGGVAVSRGLDSEALRTVALDLFGRPQEMARRHGVLVGVLTRKRDTSLSVVDELAEAVGVAIDPECYIIFFAIVGATIDAVVLINI